MRCPHCHRTWSPADLESAGGMPSTIVLDEHVRRFCAGHPRRQPGAPLARTPRAARPKSVQP